MKRLLCAALLCAVGCVSAPVGPAAEEQKEGCIRNWIPGIFADLYETVDGHIGMDYGFGAHLKLTDLARIGIFDYSDFTLVGLESGIFHGHYNFPDMDPRGKNGSWDLTAKLGVGLGASAAIHTWEVVDLLSSIVGLGYWSLNED